MSNKLPLNERLRRWRLVLGGEAAASTEIRLSGNDLGMDQVLTELYEAKREGRGGFGSSQPAVARWLGDINRYFPKSVVQVMQQDAIERLDLHQLLLQPDLLTAFQPDVQLVATLLTLKNVIPEETKTTARQVVQHVVEDLLRQLREPTRQAVQGSLNRASRGKRPRHSEIDWPGTIRRNLKHYQPAYQTIIPETLVGYGRKQTSLREVLLCVDQSGSMADSVVYSSIFAAVLASLPAIKTQMILFDTAVVDLSHLLGDPVDLLFGAQLGGGTNINKALAYCQTVIHQPQETILLLISDLFEGGNKQEMMQRVVALQASGVQIIVLLALNDRGAPIYDRALAATIANLHIPTFACTPDQFPTLMADAINQQDLSKWTAHHAQADRAG